MTPVTPVLALGLDAMEGSVVEEMLSEGRLPNLARLRARGVSGDLRTRPDGFLSMVWPTLFTGQLVGSHGWYFNKLWSPGEQRLRYVDTSWLPVDSFWDDLGGDFRCAVLDVPFSTLPGPAFNGIFVNGWQAHDDFGKLGLPPGMHRDLRRRFGRSAMGPELFGPQNVRTLERQLREGIDSLAQFADVVIDVLERGPWDLTLAVFGGAHRAMHYLWSLEEADLSGATEERLDRLRTARQDVYEAADRAVGRVLASAPDDVRVMVFALHGMGPNRGWAEHFGRIVSHIHARGRTEEAGEGLVYRLKKALPFPWVRQVTMRLPSWANHGLVPLWSRRMLDWSSTKYFALPLDLNGYIRFNVKGRDVGGIVEPGPGLEELMCELTDELMEVTDLRDGQPIVSHVERVDDIVGADAPRRDVLPDLIASWTATRAAGSPGVRTRYGEVRWDPMAHLPSGRSGNHTPGGWIMAAGPGIGPGRLSAPVDTLDVAPTLLEWMGATVPDRLEGVALREFQPSGSPTGV